MNNQEQVMAVKKALELSILISKTEENLSKFKNEKFKPEPVAPVHQTFSSVYPKIQTTVSFWNIKLLPAIICWPWIIIYYFTIYKKEKEENIESIRQSEEYRKQCDAIDKETAEKQERADKEYEQQLDEYNSSILPKYKTELKEWTEQINQKISVEENALKSANRDLSEHYEKTKIVPLQYRKIEILQYIYDMMSTSDYSVKETIDMYDKERQRRLEEERISLEEERIYQQQQANALAEEQNDLLSQQNAIDERARKDARNAAIVGVVQRHNTNKILNKYK